MLYFLAPGLVNIPIRPDPRAPYVKPWPPGTDDDDPATTRRIRDLREEADRQALLNQALWELVREKLAISDEALEARTGAIDMQGVQTGALRCPNCARVSNARHAKCLYCGLLFEKPLW